MILRVYYEDTDAGGVVYHSKYLNFCERARSELFLGLIRTFLTLKVDISCLLRQIAPF